MPLKVATFLHHDLGVMSRRGGHPDDSRQALLAARRGGPVSGGGRVGGDLLDAETCGDARLISSGVGFEPARPSGCGLDRCHGSAWIAIRADYLRG